MKFRLLSTLLFICMTSYGQIKVAKLDSVSLPKSVKHDGNIVNAVKWMDNLGLNYVVTTESGNKARGGDDFFDATLYAYHYVVKGDSAKLLWRIYDFNKGCDLDLNFYYVDKTFAVTDLDNNGVTEVWVMYKNSCHGDVSPVPTKIIMYEGVKKYALRGESRVKVSATDYMGGSYILDNNFKKGNPLFRQYAKSLWRKFKIETWHR